MWLLETKDFIDTFPIDRGTVYLLRSTKPWTNVEVFGLTGEWVSINGALKVIKTARFYASPDGQYILGILV
jgi:hypothetical protein